MIKGRYGTTKNLEVVTCLKKWNRKGIEKTDEGYYNIQGKTCFAELKELNELTRETKNKTHPSESFVFWLKCALLIFKCAKMQNYLFSSYT